MIEPEAVTNRQAIGKTLAGGMFWGTARNFTGNFFGLVLFIVLAKILPVEQVGAFSSVFTILVLISLLSALGIERSAAKFIAESSASDTGKVSSLVCSGMVITVVVSCVAGVVVLLWSRAIFGAMGKSNLAYLVPFGTILIIGKNLCTFNAYSLRALLRFRLAAVLVVGGEALRVILPCSFLLIQKDVKLVLLAMTLGFLIEGVVGSVLLARRAGFSRLDFRQSSKEILKYAVPIYVSNLSGFLYYKVDIVVLTAFASLREVAIYTLALRVFMAAQGLMSAFYQALAPLVTRLHAMGNYQKLQHVFSQSLTVVLAGGVCTFLGIVLLSKYVVGWIRPDYLSAIPLIYIFAPLLIVKPLVHLCHVSFGVSTGNAAILSIIGLFGGLANFGLDIAVVPLYGALGCAVVTLVVHCFTGGAMFIAILRRLALRLAPVFPNFSDLLRQCRRENM